MGGVSKLLMLLRTPSQFSLYNRSSLLRRVCHFRDCLDYSSSSKNHNFPLNYNNLLGFSYNFCEQLHTQTARTIRDEQYRDSSSGISTSSFRVLNSWPEWSNLVERLRFSGYLYRQSSSIHLDDALTTLENIPEEFVPAINACLLFAREQPNLLWSLSRKDIEVVVKDGSPFLFKSFGDSVRRMKSFLGFNGGNDLEHESANTVDLMYLLLSHACDPVVASGKITVSDRQHIEVSICNLLRELANASGTTQAFDMSGPASKQFSDGYGQTPRATGQNIEMKRGDWICSKCHFMNFARNVKCLDCDEPRPKDGTSGLTSNPRYSNRTNMNDFDIQSKLAANEEKAERWFSKVSQLDSSSDLSSAIADEDFPEIMPLRKGVNRFVVSTRKTPLERRLANAQYRRNLGNDGIPEESNIEMSDWESCPTTSKASISQRLDKILGRSSTAQETNNNLHSDSSAKPQILSMDGNDVPQKYNSVSGELHSGSRNTESCKSVEGFPEIMPISKAENNFLVNKNDRSITPPLQKRRPPMEQTNPTNYVPFVPFPPDYFAKKDKVPETYTSMDYTNNGTAAAYSAPESQQEPPNRQNARDFEPRADRNSAQWVENQTSRGGNWNSGFPTNGMDERKVNSFYGGTTGNSSLTPDNSQFSGRQSWNSGSSYNSYSQEKSASINQTGNSSQQPASSQYNNDSWKTGGYNGISLEGSAVKEVDPLDMSEEAKAQRWFRRVAQIKDISELSNIPDEDFPEIMPMRKGVNRFVVSKRKTPLERRLTSPQYRRNLPIMNHDPTKTDNDKS